MVQYFCQNCNDLPMKSIPSVLEHVFGKHGIEVARTQRKVERADDAHSALRRTVVYFKGFRCEECNLPLDHTVALLNHIDRAHGIHIWYERGLTSKKVFFDGTLNEPPTATEADEKKQAPITYKHIPLSQHRYELRRIVVTPKNRQRYERARKVWSKKIED